MKSVSVTIGSFLLFMLVAQVHSVCQEPTTCRRFTDECDDVQKYVNCLESQVADCSQDVKDRREVAVKLTIQTYSNFPFDCELTSGSLSIQHLNMALLIFPALLHLIFRTCC